MRAMKRRREDTEDFTVCRLVQQRTDDKGTLLINDKLLEKYLEDNAIQNSQIRRCAVAPSKAILRGTLLDRFKITEEKQQRMIPVNVLESLLRICIR